MLPTEEFSQQAILGPFLEPAKPIDNPLVDYEIGGAGISDPSEGLQYQKWKLYLDGDNITVEAEEVPPTVLFTHANVRDLSLAWDQNMRPFVAFMHGPSPEPDQQTCTIWWFDTQQDQQIFTDLPAGSYNPRATLDDKRQVFIGDSDILLIYVRHNSLYLRQQRERFQTEHLLSGGDIKNALNIGMNWQRRMQFHLIRRESTTGPDGTTFYVEVIIPATSVNTDLANFPLYIDLSNMPSDFFSFVRSDGGDIRVTTADGITQVPREVVDIDTDAHTGELHFLAPVLSNATDTAYRIYYGGGTATEPAATAPLGRNSVWEDDYVLVSHDAGITDSTGNGYDGVNSGATEVAGKMGVAYDFDASTDVVRINSALVAAGTNKVFSFLCNPDSIDPNFQNDRAYLLDINNGENRRIFSMGDDNGASATPAYYDGSNWRPFDTAEVLSAGAWNWLHYVHDEANDTVECLLDGLSIGTIAVPAGLVMEDSGTGQAIGRRALDEEEDLDDWSGPIDEVRIRTPASLTDISHWIAAEVANQKNPASFYFIGPHLPA